MYIRAAHAERDLRVLRQLIRDNPLGMFTTAIPSSSGTFPLLQSSHVPFVLDVEDESSETETGRLRGHLARQNPQSKAIIESLTSGSTSPDSTGSSGSTMKNSNGSDDNQQQQTPKNVLEQEVLVVFTSPHHHYVTPQFYTETKPATAKVVPTWNYAAAQVYGRAKIYFDAACDETSAFLGKQISDLTRHSETRIMGYTAGKNDWKVSDAPERYVELLKKNIIGIEIEVDRLEGKFKMSQEMGKGDREGIIQGFENLQTETGKVIAEVVKQRGEQKDQQKG